MIIAIWRRWVDSKQWWWLLMMAAVVLADVLIGSWLIAWELKHLKEMWIP